MSKDNTSVVKKNYNSVVDIVDSARRNIIRYSYETFIRAFPDMHDGLKPIHRRILYTMLENKIFGFAKVASITGAVMGKYHPHGDMAINDSIVRMAQPWVMNYPYIDGQGNYGTQDGDGSAAGRYIEARISDFARKAVLDDVDAVSVNYEDNYTYTLKIPEYLTSRIPLVLINGVSGIGEAFRVNIPPHNLNDIADACIKYIKNKNISNAELCDNLFPDFPTGGEIINGAEVERFYKYNEPAVISIRGVADLNTDTNTIVIKEFPYGIDCDDVSISVADAIKSGNMILSGIVVIQDENNNVDDDGSSFEQGVSTKKKKKKKTYEFICKKDANMLEILNEIYKVTALKTSITLSFMINDRGIPYYVGVLDIIKEWYKVRVDCKRRKHTNAIAQTHSRKHILEGILSIYDRMDAVVKTIRKNSSDKDGLIRELHDQFGLTVVQAKGIYEMSLGSLSGFGKADLENNIARLTSIINENEAMLINIDPTIIAELEELKEQFGRPRRTKIVMSVEEFKSKALVLSKGSFIYSRNAIGLYDMNGVKDSKNIITGLKAVKVDGKNVREILGGKGLIGKTPIAFIIAYSNGGVNRIDASVFKTINVWYDLGLEDMEVTCATPIYDDTDEIVCVTADNKLKRVSASDINGKRILSAGTVIKEMICYNAESDEKVENLLLVSKEGTYNLSPLDDIPLLSRTASGVKSAFEDNTVIFGMLLPGEIYETERLMLSSLDSRDSQNYMHGLDPAELRITNRASKPKKIGIPDKFDVTSISVMDISDKESQICMIGKASTSTLNLFNNFKKLNEYKRLFLTVTSAIQL